MGALTMDAGAIVFDYGNNIRAQAERAGFTRAFAFPGFVPAFIRPLFCRGSKAHSDSRHSPEAIPTISHAVTKKLLELFSA